MSEGGVFSGKSGADLTALKEALNAQQQLLHKLYVELDQEREASETAASEALSMILRLQGEKAAVEMEAKQYKRMAEEKMFHADECVAIFEEVIYQKDMEIAALECQIQAYKYKLLSLGCNDIDCVEMENNNESMFLQKLGSLCNGEGNSAVEDVKRSSLLPPVHPMGLQEREKARADSLAWTTKTENVFEGCKSIGVDQEMEIGSVEPPDIETYWQQIKKLDERVKGISNVKEFGRKNRRHSLGPLHSQGSINALNSCLDAAKKQLDFLQASKTLDYDSLCSSKVQDIFEVPEVSPSNNIFSKDENRREKPESPTVIKSLFKTEPRTCFNLSPDSKLFKSRGRKILDHYNLACPRATISNAESRMERLKQATNGVSTSSEIIPLQAVEIGFLNDSLNEIKTQLANIHSDIKFLKSSNSTKRNDSRFTTVQEEMLCFWL